MLRFLIFDGWESELEFTSTTDKSELQRTPNKSDNKSPFSVFGRPNLNHWSFITCGVYNSALTDCCSNLTEHRNPHSPRSVQGSRQIALLYGQTLATKDPPLLRVVKLQDVVGTIASAMAIALA